MPGGVNIWQDKSGPGNRLPPGASLRMRGGVFKGLCAIVREYMNGEKYMEGAGGEIQTRNGSGKKKLETINSKTGHRARKGTTTTAWEASFAGMETRATATDRAGGIGDGKGGRRQD